MTIDLGLVVAIPMSIGGIAILWAFVKKVREIAREQDAKRAEYDRLYGPGESNEPQIKEYVK